MMKKPEAKVEEQMLETKKAQKRESLDESKDQIEDDKAPEKHNPELEEAKNLEI